MTLQETEWKVRNDTIVGRNGQRVLQAVTMWPLPTEELDLASAAPDMARAIIRHLGEVPDCQCGSCAACDMRVAVTKAGVWP